MGPHRNQVELTAAERVLVHLHGFWNVSEPGRESTQAGIADGAQLLRSHVPRTLKALQDDGVVDSRDTRLRGQRRKIRVYALTEAGVRRARQILGDIDRTTVEVDGRTTTLGEARKALGLSALAALAATDPGGRLQARVAALERPTLLQRDQDLGILRRWLVGAAPVAVVYGSRGMGKTALGWTFAETIAKSIWVDLPDGSDLKAFVASLASDRGPTDNAERTGVHRGGHDRTVLPRDEAPRRRWLRRRGRGNRGHDERVPPEGEGRRRQAPRPRAGIDPGVLPLLLEERHRWRSRRRTTPAGSRLGRVPRDAGQAEHRRRCAPPDLPPHERVPAGPAGDPGRERGVPPYA